MQDEAWKFQFGQIIKDHECRVWEQELDLIYDGEPLKMVEDGHCPFWKAILAAV